MATNFSLKSEKNRANLFIINMIGSTYFSSNTSEKRVARRFIVDYRELSEKEQLNREQTVIRQFESLPADIFGQLETLHCTIYARVTERHACVWFRTGFEEIVMTMAQNGRVTDFSPVTAWDDCKWKNYVDYILKKEEQLRRAEKIRDNIERLRIDFMATHSLTNCAVHTQKTADQTWVWLESPRAGIIYILDGDGNTQSSFHCTDFTLRQWKKLNKRVKPRSTPTICSDIA